MGSVMIRLSVIAGPVAGLVLLGVVLVAPVSAQENPTPTARERMDQMMDGMHGEGSSQRMREAMGPDGDAMMDQCAEMMGSGMMGSGMMGSGMMGKGPGMMQGTPSSGSGSDMMPGMGGSGMMGM